MTRAASAVPLVTLGGYSPTPGIIVAVGDTGYRLAWVRSSDEAVTGSCFAAMARAIQRGMGVHLLSIGMYCATTWFQAATSPRHVSAFPAAAHPSETILE